MFNKKRFCKIGLGFGLITLTGWSLVNKYIIFFPETLQILYFKTPTCGLHGHFIVSVWLPTKKFLLVYMLHEIMSRYVSLFIYLFTYIYLYILKSAERASIKSKIRLL